MMACRRYAHMRRDAALHARDGDGCRPAHEAADAARASETGAAVMPRAQGVFEDDDSIHLVMELCEGGGILDRMKEGVLTEARIAAIIRSVLRFIAQCHAKGIIYR